MAFTDQLTEEVTISFAPVQAYNENREPIISQDSGVRKMYAGVKVAVRDDDSDGNINNNTAQATFTTHYDYTLYQKVMSGEDVFITYMDRKYKVKRVEVVGDKIGLRYQGEVAL